MEIRYEIKSYLFCFIFESAMVRSEMEVVLRCENDVLVDTLTVVDFTMLYVVWLAFHGWCHEPVVIIVSCFIGGYNQYITDHNRLVTPRVKNASQTTQNIFQFSSVYLAKINYDTRIHIRIVSWQGSPEKSRRLMNPGLPSHKEISRVKIRGQNALKIHVVTKN